MTGERRQETARIVDAELQDACAACGGPIAARFSPGAIRGVCLSCHLVTTIKVARGKGGVQLGHLPGGLA